MYCSKCGKPLQAGAEFCPHCGARLEAPSREPMQRERFPRLPGVLLSIGVGLALLIFLISWSVYGRVYFFDGYAITGILLAVIFLAKGGPYGNLRRQLALLGALVAILAVVLLCSAFLNGAGAALRPMSPAPILRRIPTNPAIAHRSTSRPFLPTT